MAEKLNNLAGGTWLQYSFSIWRDAQKNKEEWKLKHPAMFPMKLAERLIEIYTNKSNQIILDPFMGSGSVLIAAQAMKMKGVGFEISKEYCDMAKNRLEETYKSMFSKGNSEIYCDSSLNIKKYLEPNSVDLTITSPPYWDILNRKRTADKKDIRNYGISKEDLVNIAYYEYFLLSIQNVFKEGELKEESVCRKFRHTAEDGKSYETTYYNLDVIISVGYRVKSKRGTQFRIWATQRLKEYIVKGFVLDDERLKQGGKSTR